MKHVFRLFTAGWALFLAGCGPKEPIAPEPDEAAVLREKYFGPEVAKAPGITWRATGLGIRLITPGAGPAPQLTDIVRVHYLGRLKDGQVFADSHTSGGPPSDFPVNQLIAGWAAAMPFLRPGGRAEIFIPPFLGYGGRRSGSIPPNSGLIFEVELIAVNPAPPPKS